MTGATERWGGRSRARRDVVVRFTLREVALNLGITVWQVRAAVARGELRVMSGEAGPEMVTLGQLERYEATVRP